jgi:hypothetical protein
MSDSQRRISVALLKLTVKTTGPGAPKVQTNEVLDLHPGDRLLFVSEESSPGTPGPPVYVNLGSTLVGLVKFKNLPSFTVNAMADGSLIVTLDPDAGGGGPGGDPP